MKTIRSWFRVDKRRYFGYDVHCLYCNKVSKAWDYKRNAYLAGIIHVVLNHVALPFHYAGWEEEDT